MRAAFLAVDGRPAGRRARADHRARPPAPRHLRQALRRLSGAHRDAVALPLGGREQGSVARPRRRHRRHRHRHAPAAAGGRRVQAPRPAGHRRGAPLRRAPQGAHQGAAQPGRRPDADRDADPAHAADVAHGHPRPQRHRDAAGRPPGHPHLRHPLRRGHHPRGDPARARAAAARSSSCTTGWRPSRSWHSTCAACVPEARIAVAHGQMARGRAGEGHARLHAPRSRTCWCARRSSSRASTFRTPTRSSSTAPTTSASPSSTSCAGGSAARTSAPTPT